MTEPRLLSGGNPQIPKGDGDAPVRAYIEAMPGWKRAVGEQVDALVARHVPMARRAIRWNTPFYGVDGQGWFLALHCFDRYVKVTFLAGATLDPPPPVAARSGDARSIHIREGDAIDEQIEAWIREASRLPGAAVF